jgi:hypothetical protein
MKDAKGHGSEKRGGMPEAGLWGEGRPGPRDVPGYTSKGAKLLQAVVQARGLGPPIAGTPAHQSGVGSVGQPAAASQGQMKMSPENFASLSAAVAPHLASTADPAHSAMRQRWDALHKSGFDTRPLYTAGLNDDHIDTALRRIQSKGA